MGSENNEKCYLAKNSVFAYALFSTFKKIAALALPGNHYQC
jgi:hypothetical protein